MAARTKARQLWELGCSKWAAGALCQRRIAQLSPAQAVSAASSQSHSPNAAVVVTRATTAASEGQQTPVRHFLPLIASPTAQHLAAAGCVSITVSCPGSRHTHILVAPGVPGHTSAAAAAVAATGAAPDRLPTWLFGFACGSAAATAMAYSYLGQPNSNSAHQQWHPEPPGGTTAAACLQAATAAAAPSARGTSGLVRQALTQHEPGSSSNSSEASQIAEVLTGISFPGSSSGRGEGGSHQGTKDSSRCSTDGSSRLSKNGTAGSSSSSSDSSSLWDYVKQLGRFATPAARAASPPESYSSSSGSSSSSSSSMLLLPMPWEADPALGSSGSSSKTEAALASGPDGSSDAVLMRSSISQAAAAAAPAVVHIVGAGAAGGAAGSAAAAAAGVYDSSQGSGFIYDPSGYILTNAHVVLGTPPTYALSSSTSHPGSSSSSSKTNSSNTSSSCSSRLLHQQQQQQQLLQLQHTRQQAAGSSSGSSLDGSSVLVHLHDGRVFDGRVVALDRLSDLAVVAIEAPEPLPYCDLGNSNGLRVGEWVVALGSPFLLKQTVTAGIVSCVERKGSELGLTRPRTDFIQTDCAINIGNSGGPLVNLDGAVVGIANMKAAAAEGLGFAIPINTVKQLLSEMSRYGRVRRPYAGITMAEVNATRMAQLRRTCPDFPPDVASGIVVTRVAPRSPAEAAGLQEDDVIVGVSGVGAGEGLTVGVLADALKEAIGGSLELLVVREQQQQQQQRQRQQQQQDQAAVPNKQGHGSGAGSGSSSSGSNGSSSNGGGSRSSSSRYTYVTVTLKPVEASVG